MRKRRCCRPGRHATLSLRGGSVLGTEPSSGEENGPGLWLFCLVLVMLVETATACTNAEPYRRVSVDQWVATTVPVGGAQASEAQSCVDRCQSAHPPISHSRSPLSANSQSECDQALPGSTFFPLGSVTEGTGHCVLVDEGAYRGCLAVCPGASSVFGRCEPSDGPPISECVESLQATGNPRTQDGTCEEWGSSGRAGSCADWFVEEPTAFGVFGIIVGVVLLDLVVAAVVSDGFGGFGSPR
jgi:hypothetical protein